VRILLQKSFWGDERNFSGPLMRSARGDVSPEGVKEIWMAETKAAAELAFDAFIASSTPKYQKAAHCLSKDRDTLLAFYDFPAEHT
jgi:transposase-like protein